MIIYNNLTRLTFLLMGGFILLAGFGHSTVEALPQIVAIKDPIVCEEEPNVKWVYKPAGQRTHLMLYVTASCTNDEGEVLETEGRTWWKCTNVGSEPVTRNGTAFVFHGKSGLDCTGQTVQAVVKELTTYTVPETVKADNFYAQSHVQPFTDVENIECVQAYKGSVETYQSYLPIFDDGNITYRLERTVEDNVFQLYMNVFWAYQNDADGMADTHDPHTFYSAAFVTDPAVIIRSHYILGVMTHTESYGTVSPTVLNVDTIPDKTFYLKTDATKIQLGYDDVDNDSVIDNYYCGYIIDLEMDPINPFGFD